MSSGKHREPEDIGILADLAAAASDRARTQGHVVGPWTAVPGEAAVARTASCTRCGRVAYVRSEPGFVGAAGPALTEPCDAAPA